VSAEGLPRLSTVDALTAALRRRILDDDLRPGTPLREEELRREYGVARHSLRSAFRALKAEGLVEIEPNRRLVFTWGWEGEGHPIPPGSSTVEVTLEPDGEGTVVRLVHSGLPEAAVPRHAEGWDLFLPRLVEVAGADSKSTE